MAFAGLRKADNRLMLHMLVNQSKMEVLDFGEETVQLLAEDMFDKDVGYFFIIFVCVHENLLPQMVLSEKFREYSGLYKKVLRHEFKAEKSIFTGYDTLPVWNSYREMFIQKYNNSSFTY